MFRNSELKPPQLLNEIKNVCYGGCETDLKLKTTKETTKGVVCTHFSPADYNSAALDSDMRQNPRAQSDALD